MAYQRSSCELYVIVYACFYLSRTCKSGSGAGLRTSGRRRRTLQSSLTAPGAGCLSTASPTSLSGFRVSHTATPPSLNSNSVREIARVISALVLIVQTL